MYGSLYNTFKLGLCNGVHDLDSANTYKAMLVGTGYIFNEEDDFLDDISGNEISGTGYADGFAGAGRKTLSSKTLTLDTVNNRVVWTFDDLTWSAIDAGVFNAMVIFYQPAGASDDGDNIPVSYHYFGSITTDGSDETLVVDADEGGIQVL